MRSSYKRLGDYIRETNQRNSSLKVNLLLGVSIQKKFMTSIANIIGTDMSTYKIIYKNQFAYGPVTSRNGEKISIALLEDCEEAIISQAYTPFEVIDSNKLLPEYLMMWFRRPEFDRYARYMSHGSAREIFGWEELSNTLLPIPSIEKQKEIVREYNILQDRIKLNKQLIQKLEVTAQAMYKQWFVDFEFPNENGRPYKSSGGEMVWCDNLNCEIPKGWRVITYQDAFNFKTGKLNSEDSLPNGEFPFFTCSQETFKTDTFAFDCEALILAGNNASAIYPFKYFKGKFNAYQRTYIITQKHNFISIYQGYFEILERLHEFKSTSSGTATKFLTMQILNPIKIISPCENICKKFERLGNTFFSLTTLLNKDIISVSKIAELINSKLVKII